MPFSDRPTGLDLERLLDRVRPRTRTIFRQRQIPEVDAEEMVAEALMEIAFRWNRIRDREHWLLGVLERRARQKADRLQKEREDE